MVDGVHDKNWSANKTWALGADTLQRTTLRLDNTPAKALRI